VKSSDAVQHMATDFRSGGNRWVCRCVAGDPIRQLPLQTARAAQIFPLAERPVTLKACNNLNLELKSINPTSADPGQRRVRRFSNILAGYSR
jgi:hypothetical protein